jgi:hypothetical protein
VRADDEGRPRIERAAGEFGAVVAHNHRRQPAVLRELLQDAHDAQPGQRRVDRDRDGFAAEVVDDVQDAEGAAARPRVTHEVHRPPLVRLRRRREHDARAGGELLPAAAPHGEACVAVDPVDLLVVHDGARPAQHKGETRVGGAPRRARARDELGAQRAIVRSPRPVLHRGAYRVEYAA